MAQLVLERFDVDKRMVPDAMWGVLGRRGVGKSQIMFSIMQRMRCRLQSGIVFSGSEESNGFWSTVIPDSYIFSRFRESVVQSMIDYQKSRPRTAVDQDGKPCAPSVFIILDDMIHEKEALAKSPALKYIFLNGRHVKIFLGITMQECKALPPFARLQMDYMFLCHTDNYMEMEKIYKDFFSIVPSFDLFRKITNETTEDHRALVLDNKVLSSNLEERLAWYKSTCFGKPSHRIGSKKYWEIHQNYYKGAEGCGGDGQQQQEDGDGGGDEEQRPHHTTRVEDLQVNKRSQISGNMVQVRCV